MAHSNYPLLGRLLKKLDHPDNTLYLHIDAKSSFSEEDLSVLKQNLTHSTLCLAPRLSVSWGGYSQVECILGLIKEGVKGHHDYYHLISGVDFPTKPMAAIHRFFEEHKGQEFFHFCDEEFVRKNQPRYSLYYPFQDRLGRDFKSPLYWAQRVLLAVQRRLLRVNRARKFPDTVYQMGSCWGSFTHAFAEYTLSKEAEIQAMFSKGFCVDEVFFQTILYNSPFRQKAYQAQDLDPYFGSEANLRSIDWTREGLAQGAPYTYDVRDYDLLVCSPNLFCRKVDTDTPQREELIQKLELL